MVQNLEKVLNFTSPSFHGFVWNVKKELEVFVEPPRAPKPQIATAMAASPMVYARQRSSRDTDLPQLA
jgi:hypothetical protein